MKTFKEILNQCLTEAKGRKVKGPGKWDNDGKYYETTEEEFYNWYNKLGFDDVVDGDVVIETGEVVMEKGESRRKKLKQKGKRDYNEYGAKSFESIKMRAKERIQAPLIPEKSQFFEVDFHTFYNVKFEPIWKATGVDKEEMITADYDVEQDMPVSIKRKDGLRLKENDIYNINQYQNYFNKQMQQFSPNMKLEIYATKGKKEATTNMLFV